MHVCIDTCMHKKSLQYSEQKNAFFIYASLSLNTYIFSHTDIHNLINKVTLLSKCVIWIPCCLTFFKIFVITL